MPNELKPCPWCAKTNIRIMPDCAFRPANFESVKWKPLCFDCGASLTRDYPTEEAAATAWNTRPLSLDQQREEKLVEVVEKATKLPLEKWDADFVEAESKWSLSNSRIGSCWLSRYHSVAKLLSAVIAAMEENP